MQINRRKAAKKFDDPTETIENNNFIDFPVIVIFAIHFEYRNVVYALSIRIRVIAEQL